MNKDMNKDDLYKYNIIFNCMQCKIDYKRFKKFSGISIYFEWENFIISNINICNSQCNTNMLVSFIDYNHKNTNKKITLNEIKTMHQFKTGALINASCLMPLIASENNDTNMLNCIDAYSKSIGLIFQIKDDILDKEANKDVLGKTPGKDEKDNKSTFVSLLGIDESKKLAANYYESALTSIKPLGRKADYLAGIAEFVMTRTH